jgi:2-polyprenyl-6-methoxyphenol hydroxylase-like FAD-dependent oxidoreductase
MTLSIYLHANIFRSSWRTRDTDGVEAEVTGPDGAYTVRARFAVGCDGGRSLVRREAGIDFPGTGGRVTARLGDVILADRENAPMGMERTERGLLFCVPLDDTYHRVSTFDFAAEREPGPELTLDELTASLRDIWGDDLGAHAPRWLSVFTDSACQADRYREGRLLIAGDAAHTHFPVGGQGVNLGLQDAFNLGWKLAAEVHGWAPEGLLDSYDRERQAPARKVLANTRAQIALMNPDPYVTPLRELFTDLMRKEQVNRHLAEMLSGVTVRYPIDGPEHRLLGDFARDLEPLECAQEPALAGLLVRPDGYVVAWAADRDMPEAEVRESLTTAVTTWFGTV